MILEYVHAAFQRESYGVDVYGFVEEGNVDRPLADEGSRSRQTGTSHDHFLGPDSCCLHLYHPSSSVLEWETQLG